MHVGELQCDLLEKNIVLRFSHSSSPAFFCHRDRRTALWRRGRHLTIPRIHYITPAPLRFTSCTIALHTTQSSHREVLSCLPHCFVREWAVVPCGGKDCSLFIVVDEFAYTHIHLCVCRLAWFVLISTFCPPFFLYSL